MRLSFSILLAIIRAKPSAEAGGSLVNEESSQPVSIRGFAHHLLLPDNDATANL